MSDDDLPEPEVMDIEELREEYQEITKEIYEELSIVDDDVYDRAAALWRELRDRVDVDQPECPECESRDWGQNPGDPVHCNGCGWTPPHPGHEDLVEEINEAWTEIHGKRGEA